MRSTLPLAAGLVLAALLAGCGAEATPSAAPATPAPPADADDAPLPADAVEVVGVDYGFDGLPPSVTPGTALSFRNASAEEFHEMVVMRVADGEDRPVEELIGLPEDQLMPLLSFVGVAAAAPEETGTVVDGDLTLVEAGRYVLVCFIPQGADPELVEATFLGEEPADGPPDLGDGPPHAMVGMARDLTVG